MNAVIDQTSTGTSKEESFFGVTTVIGEADATPVVVTEAPETAAAPAAAKHELASRPAGAQRKHEEDDPEMQQLSENVKKRISKMRWKQGEIERERDEAYRVAQTLHRQNQQYEQTIHTGEARLVAEIKQRALNDVEMAKRSYAEAYEKGDTTAIIAAQEKMLNASADLRSANEYSSNYLQRSAIRQQNQQRQAAVQPQVPSIPKPTEDASFWAENNKWFGDPRHPDMTALAYGVHERLVKREGIMPDTPEYFRAIDTEMHQHFPQYFSASQTSTSVRRDAPTTVVAGGQREAASTPRQVTLTPSQVKLAKRLGLSLEQYAKQLIKGN